MGVVERELLGKNQLLIGKSRLTDGWILQRCADGDSALSAENMITWRVTAWAIFTERLDIEKGCKSGSRRGNVTLDVVAHRLLPLGWSFSYIRYVVLRTKHNLEG